MNKTEQYERINTNVASYDLTWLNEDCFVNFDLIAFGFLSVSAFYAYLHIPSDLYENAISLNVYYFDQETQTTEFTSLITFPIAGLIFLLLSLEAIRHFVMWVYSACIFYPSYKKYRCHRRDDPLQLIEFMISHALITILMNALAEDDELRIWFMHFVFAVMLTYLVYREHVLVALLIPFTASWIIIISDVVRNDIWTKVNHNIVYIMSSVVVIQLFMFMNWGLSVNGWGWWKDQKWKVLITIILDCVLKLTVCFTVINTAL